MKDGKRNEGLEKGKEERGRNGRAEGLRKRRMVEAERGMGEQEGVRYRRKMKE